ncbi:MAG: response regulator [Bacteroidetes bacterium]|nr:response regulator [Bacteroidota bacterium]
MKINLRLLLITFSIIVVISVTSTLVFFSVTNTILQSKLSNSFLKSSYDFVLAFQTEIGNINKEYAELSVNESEFSIIDIDTTNLDFIFIVDESYQIERNSMRFSSNSLLNFSSFQLGKFVENNPNLILFYSQENNKQVYYGKIINEKFLNQMAEKSRVEIMLLVNDTPYEYSNSTLTNQQLPSLVQISKSLKDQPDFSVYSEELLSTVFFATIYSFNSAYLSQNEIKFLLHTTSIEAFEVRDQMGVIMLVLIVTGVALSLIFVLLFTTKLRKQISYLSEAAEHASKGDFNRKVSIVSKDELGLLAKAFNKMLSELRQKEKREKEYAEFLTLLNQNPTLNEIAEESLKVILKELGMNYGAFFTLTSDKTEMVSALGYNDKTRMHISNESEIKSAISEGKIIEIDLSKEKIKINTGLEIVEIKYALVVPITYHRKVIAVIEIASNSSPQMSPVDYINLIHDQLAVGIANADTYSKLEISVEELKKLNVQYLKQNERITDKNEQLVKLHTEIKQKAEELEKEKNKAEEMTVLKSQFLASVSHELRTPLNSIIGLTELILKDELHDGNTKKRLNVVFRNGKKLLSLINNILDYLKIESGKTNIKKDSFLLSALLREIEQFFEPLVKDKDLTFIIDYKPVSDLLLISDRRKLEQILINLIGNAVKFTSKGQVTLSIRLLGESELKMTVRDTGIGIKEEDLAIIFDEFRQADGGISRRYEGTGLGLTISSNYARLLGGELYADSEYGKGSDFHLLLKNTPIEEIEFYEHTKFTKFTETADKKNLSPDVILVVENPDTEKMLKDYLELNNFCVSVIKNENELFAQFWNSIKLIVIDQNISLANNWQLLCRLKKSETFAKVPVTMVCINESLKLGYGFAVYDYFMNEMDDKLLERIIKEYAALFTKKTPSLFYLSDHPEITEESINEYKVKSVSFDEYHLSDISADADLIVINSTSNSSKVIKIIDEIKHFPKTKNIPILCRLIEFTGEIQSQWANELNEVMISKAHHPLDVLKVLRDRLTVYFDDGITEANIDVPAEVAVPGKYIQVIDRRIMIVDDDPDALYTIGEILSEINVEYITASNGVECLSKLNNMRPSIILMDIMMPQMNGFETIGRIKSIKELSQIPIIALTAYAMLENKDIIEKHGFVDLITKPVNSEELHQKIKNYIGA